MLFRSFVLLILAMPVFAQVEENKPTDVPRPKMQRGLTPLVAPPLPQAFTDEGVRVVFDMAHVDPARKNDPVYREGDSAIVRFSIADTTGEPLTSLYPAGWMDLASQKQVRGSDACIQKVKSFLSGSLFSRAEIDLNVYFVITLNDDATLTVVDPLFGFGTTKLLAIVELESPGEDWALTEDQSTLYVSMPAAGKVAVVDTASWKVRESITVGPYPSRVVLQSDEKYLWVSNDRHEDLDSGVTVVDTKTSMVASVIQTGRGYHRIAMSGDNRFAFISSSASDTVSIVDVAALEKVKELKTGKKPGALAYSASADAVYVAHEDSGNITAIDARSHLIRADIPAKPGLSQLRIDPSGRFAFAVNPSHDFLYIVDTAVNRIAQSGDVREEPVQVNFSDTLAYITHRGSDIVYMVSLSEIREGTPLSVVDIPGGEHPHGKNYRPSPASGIVQAPGANAVLITNPLDEAIYFYKEGMAAPMGSFKNYGRMPRAVTVVDRSLKERYTPGVYETVVHFSRAGIYEVPFLLDSPRMVHCFMVDVQEDPERAATRELGKVMARPIFKQQTVPVGEPYELAFRLFEKRSGEPKTGLGDVRILTNLSPGIWHKRWSAVETSPGVYVVRDFVPPRAGVYYIYAGSGTAGLPLSNHDYGVIRAAAAQSRNPNNP